MHMHITDRHQPLWIFQLITKSYSADATFCMSATSFTASPSSLQFRENSRRGGSQVTRLLLVAMMHPTKSSTKASCCELSKSSSLHQISRKQKINRASHHHRANHRRTSSSVHVSEQSRWGIVRNTQFKSNSEIGNNELEQWRCTGNSTFTRKKNTSTNHFRALLQLIVPDSKRNRN